MVHVVAVVKRWGNSLGVIIEKETTRRLGIKEGEKLDIDILPKKRVVAFGITSGAKGFEREKEEREF